MLILQIVNGFTFCSCSCSCSSPWLLHKNALSVILNIFILLLVTTLAKLAGVQTTFSSKNVVRILTVIITRVQAPSWVVDALQFSNDPKFKCSNPAVARTGMKRTKTSSSVFRCTNILRLKLGKHFPGMGIPQGKNEFNNPWQQQVWPPSHPGSDDDHRHSLLVGRRLPRLPQRLRLLRRQVADHVINLFSLAHRRRDKIS